MNQSGTVTRLKTIPFSTLRVQTCTVAFRRGRRKNLIKSSTVLVAFP